MGGGVESKNSIQLCPKLNKNLQKRQSTLQTKNTQITGKEDRKFVVFLGSMLPQYMALCVSLFRQFVCFVKKKF